jgi:IclR family pca regulon transcriptional regulator
MGRLNASDAEARAARPMPDGVNPADFSEGLARGLRVLTAFSGEHPRMTLADAARAVSLPRATVRRALATLVQLGYLTLDGRVYELSPRVLELAAGYLSANPLSTILQPACERITGQVGESCTVAVLDGADAVMIARAVPRNPLRLGTGVGFRVPAVHSALGRVLLAELKPAALDAFFAAIDVPETTSQAVTNKAELRALIGQARDQGFAYAGNETEVGFHSVAVPVRRWDGRQVAAMNIGAPVERVDREAMTGPMLAVLRDATAELSRQLL